jgi:hypothetical protein
MLRSQGGVGRGRLAGISEAECLGVRRRWWLQRDEIGRELSATEMQSPEEEFEFRIPFPDSAFLLLSAHSEYCGEHTGKLTTLSNANGQLATINSCHC